MMSKINTKRKKENKTNKKKADMVLSCETDIVAALLRDKQGRHPANSCEKF